MGDLLAWVSSNWDTILMTSLAVIGGAAVILRAIAPLTKTKKDDKLVAFLSKVELWLSKVALHSKKEE